MTKQSISHHDPDIKKAHKLILYALFDFSFFCMMILKSYGHGITNFVPTGTRNWLSGKLLARLSADSLT